MADPRWLRVVLDAYQAQRLPVPTTALKRMLDSRAWLGELPSVRTLWEQVFRAYVRDLLDVRPIVFKGWNAATRRAALIYFANTAPTASLASAHDDVREAIAVTAARVPSFAHSSAVVLDDAIANVAAHVRLTRVARRIANA